MENLTNDIALIAEFMELKPCEHPYEGAFTCTFSEKLGSLASIIDKEMTNESWYFYPRFHESWDWLLSVVEKLEPLTPYKEFRIAGNSVYVPGVFIKKGREYWQGGETKFEAVFKAVIELIKWHNNQKV